MRPNFDHIFSALADPTRRAILARLASGEASVSELAAPFAVSLPAISRHLKVLERAALIARERDGQFWRCRLAPESLREAAGWLDRYRIFWNESFDRLAEHLIRRQPAKEGSHGRSPRRPRRSSASRRRS